jgi:prophage regulatory protein
MSEHNGRRIVRGYRALEERVGKSRVQIWRDIRRGLFPAPIELGPNSIAWFEDEIASHLESRPRRTYAASPGGKAA